MCLLALTASKMLTFLIALLAARIQANAVNLADRNGGCTLEGGHYRPLVRRSLRLASSRLWFPALPILRMRGEANSTESPWP